MSHGQLSVSHRLAVAELGQNLAQIGEEIEHWHRETRNVSLGGAVQPNQIEAGSEVLITLRENIEGMLSDLAVLDEPLAFAQMRADVEYELIGLYSTIAVLRRSIEQHSASFHRPLLGAAALVAADSYETYMRFAQGWRVDLDDAIRPPPLVYLSTGQSPVAYSRQYTFAGLGSPSEALPDVQLPIALIALPGHHLTLMRKLCAMYHEIGHILDYDLGISANLRSSFAVALADLDQTQAAQWGYWLPELVADAFGVLMGGHAFAQLLADMLSGSPTVVHDTPAGTSHPYPPARIRLLATLLCALDAYAFAEAAAGIERDWQAVYGEPSTSGIPYVDTAARIASLVLVTPLDALGGHSMSEFGALLKSHSGRLDRLVNFLRLGIDRPPPNGSAHVPARLVPAAAQLACSTMMGDLRRGYERIQYEAADYISAVANPEYLQGGAPLSPKQRERIRALSRGFRFSQHGPQWPDA